MTDIEDPFEAIARGMRERREAYKQEVFDTQPFQDALCYLQGIASDFLTAQTHVTLQGSRYSARDDYLLFRFAPHAAEATIAITTNARAGLQNAARRELRFLLESSVKLSARDAHREAKGFDDRLAGLNGRDKRFEDYVAELKYFEYFENPKEANDEILSLYKDLSRYVHATAPQFEHTLRRDRRDEAPGMESVATLNAFNKLAFKVYDLVLVRIFHGLGLSMASDIFTGILDDEPKWRFHKAKYVKRLSKCFDYKAERQARRGET